MIDCRVVGICYPLVVTSLGFRSWLIEAETPTYKVKPRVDILLNK
jgi:hypothetical protein